jgi:long-subunit fatty acid transport protein
MDGYSIGGGYNYKVNEKFSVRPSIHYVDIDVNSTVNLTIEESSGTFDTGGSDQLLEVGMELAYAINDNSNISFIYTRYLDDMGTAEDINTMGISYKHSF